MFDHCDVAWHSGLNHAMPINELLRAVIVVVLRALLHSACSVVQPIITSTHWGGGGFCPGRSVLGRIVVRFNVRG